MGLSSILDALAISFFVEIPSNNQEQIVWRKSVQKCYSLYPNYEALVNTIRQSKKQGDGGITTTTQVLLSTNAPRVGVPISTMSGYPETSIEKVF